VSVEEAVARIRARAPDAAPEAALVLGSGLGAVAEIIETPQAIPYAELPGFPEPTVEGHAGRLLLGRIAGLPVACLQGRVHLYEGLPASAIRTPIRCLRRLGAKLAVLTNAAGGLDPATPAGSLMLISDHINLMGQNPLTGRNDDGFGPRFPDMSAAYDADLRGRLRTAAAAEGISLHEGVYLACLGPSFETPAEIRAFRRLGADAVGMSTVPECLVARHAGMRVAALSVISNLAAGLGDAPPSHEATLAAVAAAAQRVARLLHRLCAELAAGTEP